MANLNMLYRLLKRVLDFYLKLGENPEFKDFKTYPHGPSAANKIIEGIQMTVIWHVDDLKVSRVKSDVGKHQICRMGERYLW